MTDSDEESVYPSLPTIIQSYSMPGINNNLALAESHKEVNDEGNIDEKEERIKVRAFVFKTIRARYIY